MIQTRLPATSAVLALTLCGSAVFADVMVLDSSSDTYIRADRSYSVHGVAESFDIRFNFVSYTQFDMSGLNVDEISDATLTLYKVGNARNDTITNGRFTAWGLPAGDGLTAQDWHETEDFDPNDGFNGLDFRNVGADWLTTGNGINQEVLVSLDPEGGIGGTHPSANVTEVVDNGTGMITLSGQGLVDFLNARADDNGYVTFITGITDTTGRGWGIASKENADTALHPKLSLTYSAVPEPASAAVVALGGTALLRRRLG